MIRKKLFLYLNYFILTAFICNSSEMEKADRGENSYASRLKIILNKYQEDFNEWFSEIDESQLHFFWTRGIKKEDLKTEFGATHHVDIGGKKYGKTFPVALETLLENTPSRLKIRLILDDITLESNKGWINPLVSFYPQRFNILFIKDVIVSLSNIFPEQKSCIEEIFRHAQSGNPAIASDIYRLLIATDFENYPLSTLEKKTLYLL